MERYLLFDSGCSLCSNLAQSVQAESNGLLMARSLREPAIQAILNEVKPGWKWEPMLLEMDDDGSQQVFSGLQMRLRIVSKLGLSHAWRIAKLVGRSQLSASTQHTGRRSFLRYAGSTFAGLTMWALTGSAASSSEKDNTVFLPTISRGGGDLLTEEDWVTLRSSSYFQQLTSRLVSETPTRVWEEEGFKHVAFDLLSTSRVETLSVRDIAVFGFQDGNVSFALTAEYDLNSAKVAVIVLNEPSLNSVYDMSPHALNELEAANLAANHHRSTSIGDDSIDQQNCYYVCVSRQTVQGRMDNGCLAVCSAGCYVLGGWRRSACMAGCRAACWIPGYTICVEWKRICGGH